MDLWIGTVALGLCVVCISTGNCPLIYIQLCIKELHSPWGNLRLGGLRKIHEGFWKNNCTWIALCSATPRYRLVKVLCTCPQWSKPPKIIWLNWMKPGLGQRWSVSLPPYNRSPRTGTGSTAVKAIDGRDRLQCGPSFPDPYSPVVFLAHSSLLNTEFYSLPAPTTALPAIADVTRSGNHSKRPPMECSVYSRQLFCDVSSVVADLSVGHAMALCAPTWVASFIVSCQQLQDCMFKEPSPYYTVSKLHSTGCSLESGERDIHLVYVKCLPKERSLMQLQVTPLKHKHTHSE